MVPVRTCIGCRRTSEQGQMVRFALERSTSSGVPKVMFDANAGMPGRGAWLHPVRQCFDAAVTRKAFQRAFRAQVEVGLLDFGQISQCQRSGHEA